MDMKAILQTVKPYTNVRHYFLSLFFKLILFLDGYASYRHSHSIDGHIIKEKAGRTILSPSTLLKLQVCLSLHGYLACDFVIILPDFFNTQVWSREIREVWWDTAQITATGISSLQEPGFGVSGGAG